MRVCVCVCVMSKGLTLAPIGIMVAEVEEAGFAAVTFISLNIITTFTHARYDKEVNRVIVRETDTVVFRTSGITLAC